MSRTPITLPSTTANKLVNMQGLANYDAKIKDWVDDQIAALPEDQYLDQTKTTIVENFTWSAVDYPGSTDPSLDGKPVLVFAVANADTTSGTPAIKYSFISLNKLVDVYTGNASGDTIKGIEVSVDVNRKITAEAKLYTPQASEATNLLTIDSTTGELYVPAPAAFDATGLTTRISNLETAVGNDGTDGNPKTGIQKDISDINTEIGVKADASTSTVASGMYKYVDDTVKAVDDKITFIDSSDIDALFA